MKRAVGIGLKLAITLSILAVVSRDVEWEILLQSVVGAEKISIAASFLVLLALSLLQTFRWQAILRVLGTFISYRSTWSIVLIGIFFSQLLPTSIGGDAVRIWKLRQKGAPLARAFNSVVLDRVCAFLVVVFIMSIGVTLLYDLWSSFVMRSLVAIALASTACGLLLLVLIVRVPVIGQFVTRVLGQRVGSLINNGVKDAAAVLFYPRLLAATLILSLLMQLAISGVVWILAIGIEVQIGIVQCVVLVPFVILASMLPISIAGWGVREGAMVFALGFAGVDTTTALTISVLFGVILATTGLPGGLLWLYERRVVNQAQIVSDR